MDPRGSISIVEGNAAYPMGEGNKIIVHVCNNIGIWGGGFTDDLTERWLKPEIAYLNWSMKHDPVDSPMELGVVMKVKVEEDIWVANLIGQKGIARHGTVVPPIRYDAIRTGLARVAMMAYDLGATVHMPKIGTGLAGGDWNQIQPIIEAELCGMGIDVTVYCLMLVTTVGESDY